MLGYKKMEIINDIKILSEGAENMGTHYIASGNALRLIENETNIKDIFKKISIHQLSVTRLDIAIDIEQTKEFNLDRLKKDITRGNILSKWRKSTEIIERTTATGEITGNTIYLGSRTSSVFLRIYNKELESEKEEYKNIIRLELELKKESAENAIKELLKKEVGQVIKGILNNYMRIVEPSEQKNKSRWHTKKYWNDFIQDIEKIKLSKGILENNLEGKIEWFFKQNAPSMALIHAGENELLQEILTNGFNRLKNKDLIILDNYIKNKNLKKNLI